MTENSSSPNLSAGGNFMEIMWQKTALIFMLYSLIRWLKPSILPDFMLAKSWFNIDNLMACAVPGAILAVFSLLIRVGGRPPQQK